LFQNLSLSSKRRRIRAGRRERRFENTKAKQNRISLRVREKTAREHASRDERESLFTCLKCVESKDFSPGSIKKKCPKISSAGFFFLLILQNTTLYKNHVFLTFNESLLPPLPPTEEEDAPTPPPVFPPPAMMIPLSGSPPLAETPPLAEAAEEE